MRKKLAVATLAAVMAFTGLAGCNSGGETGKAPEMPEYEHVEDFRIGNWGTPPHANTGHDEYVNNPDYCTEEHWANMRDCGFNLAIPTAGPSVAEIERDLEMADKVGMKMLVRDLTNAGFEAIIKYAQGRGYGYEETRAELEKRSDEIKANIDAYAKHPSFQGVNAYDEPSVDYYEPISACQDWFLKNYPEYEFYSNLLPVYANPQQLFGSQASKGYNYEDYVSMFRKTVNPSSLSYDHYPYLANYDGSKYLKNDFMYNLGVFANEAKKAKVPMYLYVQSMGFLGNLPVETYEEFAWQCYVSLAFGARGIMCFQYWTQLQSGNNVCDGIVERDGTIRPLYYEVQKVFNDIKSMQDIYLHYTWEGVKTYEHGVIVNDQFDMVNVQLEELADISKISGDQDILIGQFASADRSRAYMVTNASSPFEEETANVELTFEGYNYAMVVKNGQKELVKLDNHVLKMAIGSGEGNFVVPLK